MKLGIILNTNNPETAWNALRLGNEALASDHETTLFLLGNGVEIQQIKHEQFTVTDSLKNFLNNGGNLLACGTCLGRPPGSKDKRKRKKRQILIML